MQGQWLGEIQGEFNGTLRIELECRERDISGNAYLFYDPVHDLPGFTFSVNISKSAPHVGEVDTIYLYPDGGRMSQDDRNRAEVALKARFGDLPIPSKLNVEFALEGSNLVVKWVAESDAGDP